MKKKGFTLVEVLAVIVIVGILLVIAVPQVLSMIKRGTRSYYHGIENDMKVAGVDYMETYRTLLPREIGNTSVVTLEELINSDYIDEVKDEKGNTCTGKVAIVKTKKNSYKYYSCLICGDYYESSENDCSYDEYNNKYADAADYSIETDSDIYEVGQGKEFTSPLARVYYKGQLIKDDLKGRPVKIDTNKIGTYDLIFYYHGAMKKVDIKVKDETDPEKTSVVLRLDNKDGKSYKSNWYNGNVYAEYKASDYTKKGISGSGIAYYEVSEDKETWTKVEGNSEIIEKEGNYLRYVRAVDKDGNTGKIKEYRIMLDHTKPEVNLESLTSKEALYNSRYINTKTSVSDNFTKTYLCFTTVNDFTKCNWEEVEDFIDRDYTLPNEDGAGTQYTFYVFATDLAGNVSVSSKPYKLYTKCSVLTETGRGNWSGCDRACGGGTDRKPIYYKDTYLGMTCPNGTETRSCNTMDCCSSTHTEYGGWSGCSAACGGGTQTQSYNVVSNYNGQSCGGGTNSQSCNTQGCCSSTTSSCGSYGSCSTNCGSGTMSRSCTKYSSYNGQNCGSYTETSGCSASSGCSSGGGSGCYCKNGKPTCCIKVAGGQQCPC